MSQSPDPAGRKIFVSVVIPILNEEENLPELNDRLTRVLAAYDASEIIYVDDGSTDSSVELIRQYGQTNQSVKLIQFSRNFGHQTAISAGLYFSRGEAVVLMDGDLQDPPEVLPQFIETWRQGWDVVYAIRTKRKEHLLKRAAYAVFYKLLQKVSSIDIPLDSGDFSLIDRRVVNHINALPERNRFVRGLRTWVGFKQIGLPYERDARHRGKPKYTFFKLLALAYDGLTGFSHSLLRLAIAMGLMFTILAALGIVYVLIVKLTGEQTIEGWVSTIIAILFMGGVQLLFLGVFGEYLAKIFDEVKHRPVFVVKELYNFESPPGPAQRPHTLTNLL